MQYDEKTTRETRTHLHSICVCWAEIYTSSTTKTTKHESTGRTQRSTAKTRRTYNECDCAEPTGEREAAVRAISKNLIQNQHIYVCTQKIIRNWRFYVTTNICVDVRAHTHTQWVRSARHICSQEVNVSVRWADKQVNGIWREALNYRYPRFVKNNCFDLVFYAKLNETTKTAFVPMKYDANIYRKII